jgi:mycoredoxin
LLLGIGIALVPVLAWSAPVAAGIEGVLVLVLALVFSPWCFPRPMSLADARRLSAADGMPIVLWRPGCQYCLRLRLYLLGTGAWRLHWVDIWSDPDAAAALRGYADGNETVPTVLVLDDAHVNPAPAWVRQLARTPAATTPPDHRDQPD